MDPQLQTPPLQPAPASSRKQVLIIGTIIFIVACLLGAFFAKLHRDAHPEEHIKTPYFDMIVINNHTYVPAYLLVKPNTTIAWHNADNKTHQLAITGATSDPNISKPDKTIKLKSGSNYSMVLTKTGIYKYNDPQYPQYSGAVEVK